ncbi:homoserine O-succinyltransferase, partial [Salmonella enterica subsp. enterica serovar Anatum]|nr:homoserine O-succinyltransferase [Salmonella enterica subsp. enterica serovar Anatum]
MERNRLARQIIDTCLEMTRLDARESRNTPAEHLNNFYCNFDDICDQNFDGLIVTGAPLGLV